MSLYHYFGFGFEWFGGFGGFRLLLFGVLGGGFSVAQFRLLHFLGVIFWLSVAVSVIFTFLRVSVSVFSLRRIHTLILIFENL